MELSKIKEFNSEIFGNLTVLRDINNNCWFKATEIAEKLGYSNPHDAITRHCVNLVKHEVWSKQYVTGSQLINIIPEPDLYRLIFSSKLESAVKFQNWVFEEVLPSIRQLGMYATDDVIEKMLNDKEWGVQLLIRVRDGLDKAKVKKQIAQVKETATGFTGVNHLFGWK